MAAFYANRVIALNFALFKAGPGRTIPRIPQGTELARALSPTTRPRVLVIGDEAITDLTRSDPLVGHLNNASKTVSPSRSVRGAAIGNTGVVVC